MNLNPDIITQEAILKINMVEPAWVVHGNHTMEFW